MSSNIIHFSKKLFLTLIMPVFLISCGASLADLQTDLQSPEAGHAIAAASILIEPVPEWKKHDNNYWLSIWRGPVPRKEYTITLQPNVEKDLLLQLPEGIYEISAIYEGKKNSETRGYGRKGAIGLWFEIKEGEIQYLGRLKLTISPDNAFLRRQKDEAVDKATRSISRAFFGAEIGGKVSRPVMYTSVSIENNINGAVELLQKKGWEKSAAAKIKETFISASRPE